VTTENAACQPAVSSRHPTPGRAFFRWRQHEKYWRIEK